MIYFWQFPGLGLRRELWIFFFFFISPHCESKPTDFHTLPSFTAQTPPPRSLQRKPWAYPSNIHLYSFLPPRKTLIQRLFFFYVPAPFPQVHVSNPRPSTFLTKLTQRISVLRKPSEKNTEPDWQTQRQFPKGGQRCYFAFRHVTTYREEAAGTLVSVLGSNRPRPSSSEMPSHHGEKTGEIHPGWLSTVWWLTAQLWMKTVREGFTAVLPKLPNAATL